MDDIYGEPVMLILKKRDTEIESLKLQVEAYRKALETVCLGKEAACCRWCGAAKGQAHYEPEACSVLNRDMKA